MIEHLNHQLIEAGTELGRALIADQWIDTPVSELVGGQLIKYQGHEWRIVRLLWGPNARRDVRLEPVDGDGLTIDRTFHNWSTYPARKP